MRALKVNYTELQKKKIYQVYDIVRIEHKYSVEKR